MKLNIELLQEALFWWCRSYLDLDTGEILPVSSVSGNTAERRNLLALPLFCQAPVYQAYLDKLSSERKLEGAESLLGYPRFELHSDNPSAIEQEYIDRAFHYLESLDLGECSTGLEKFEEFKHQYTRSFSEKWCENEGYKWTE